MFRVALSAFDGRRHSDTIPDLLTTRRKDTGRPMKSIVSQLRSRFADALVKVMGEEGRDVDAMIRPAADPAFGDYQSNAAMGLAKRLKARPRELAQRVVDALAADPDVAVMCEPFEIAGPGFINIRLRTGWLADQLNAIPADNVRLGMEPVAEPLTVVVDYSSPNIAKQMHVGHLRSTIIGDTIARVLAFEGHDVIRQNHIGDWGTQFGMLIAHLKEAMPAALDGSTEVQVGDLEKFYQQANKRAESDTGFRERSRAEVVALHNREPETMRAWSFIVDESRRHYMPIYRRLGVLLAQEDERGESFYAERLPGVVSDLEKGFGANAAPSHLNVVESDGALCVFINDDSGKPRFVKPDGDPLPMIIRKSDGAFLYATTDLAALRFRVDDLGAKRIIYVTDARQAQHFEMVFATVRAAGWAADEVQLEHVTFGSILGDDRRPLKTRTGENIKLADLLEEAVQRAERLIRDNEADPGKKRGFEETEIRDVAEAVGIGAVKYADLSQNRQSDYVFNWDRMLAMEGNTAPYMMYAYARIRSIYRKGAESGGALAGEVRLGHPAECNLARQILRFAETVESVASGLRINLLTDYLYELAGSFMKFYEACPVLRADGEAQRASRLQLCDLTARTLRVGLDLLGIRVVERM